MNQVVNRRDPAPRYKPRWRILTTSVKLVYECDVMRILGNLRASQRTREIARSVNGILRQDDLVWLPTWEKIIRCNDEDYDSVSPWGRKEQLAKILAPTHVRLCVHPAWRNWSTCIVDHFTSRNNDKSVPINGIN